MRSPPCPIPLRSNPTPSPVAPRHPRWAWGPTSYFRGHPRVRRPPAPAPAAPDTSGTATRRAISAPPRVVARAPAPATPAAAGHEQRTLPIARRQVDRATDGGGPRALPPGALDRRHARAGVHRDARLRHAHPPPPARAVRRGAGPARRSRAGRGSGRRRARPRRSGKPRPCAQSANRHLQTIGQMPRDAP
jgi:hypothetical protein